MYCHWDFTKSRTTSMMWSVCSGVRRSISRSSSFDFYGAVASVLKNSCGVIFR